MLGGASQAAQLINKATILLCIYLGARAVLQGELTVGALVAFNMRANQVHGPVLRLAQMWQDFQQVRISTERLSGILNNPAEPSQRLTGRPGDHNLTLLTRCARNSPAPGWELEKNRERFWLILLPDGGD